MMEMKYYEFNKHDYYALIKAETAQKAIEIYVENVAGESVEQVKAEGDFDLLNKYDAFVKFAFATTEVETSIKQLVNDFENDTIKLLLIDGSLI